MTFEHFKKLLFDGLLLFCGLDGNAVNRWSFRWYLKNDLDKFVLQVGALKIAAFTSHL